MCYCRACTPWLATLAVRHLIDGCERCGQVRELGVSDTLIMVQKLVAEGKVRISEHGYDELADDNIFAIDVLDGVDAAVAVEDYPQSAKGPSVLVLQKDTSDRPIHVLWGIPRGCTEPAVVVTAYRPDLRRWSNDFMKRKPP